MKRILLLFFCVGVLMPVFAQVNSSGKVWTLRELVDYAIANNLTVKRSSYNIETGEVNYLQSKATMLPTLNASASHGYNSGRNIDPFTNQPTEQRIITSNVNANASLLLWNGFRLFYSMKQAGVELEALNEDMIKSRNDVILNVINLYINVVFNKELYNNAGLQLKSTQEQLNRTRKLAEAGSVPRADVLNLEAQVATNELNLIQRENAVNLTLLQLKQALQLPSGTVMDVALPEVDIDAEQVINKSAEEIFEIATLNMPEIKAARLRTKSSEYSLRSTRGNLYPRISLNAQLTTLYSDQRRQRDLSVAPIAGNPYQIGYVDGTATPVMTVPYSYATYLPDYSEQFKNNLGKGFGFNIQVPIFNGLSSRSAVQRASINRNVAGIALTETENGLRQTVETAYNDAVASIKTYNSSQKQVQARDEAYRMTKQRFENGAVNYVEYQVAENDLFQAQSDLVRAKYDFIFRKKVLDFFQGLSLGF